MGKMKSSSDKPNLCSACPLYSTGKGFCLGVGDFSKSKLLFQFETPAKDEIKYRLGDGSLSYRPEEKITWEKREIERRRAAYPDLEDKFIKTGSPVVGRTGGIFDQWELKAAGINRMDISIDNTLRCLPPKKSESNYPTGEDRVKAEKACRVYDRVAEFDPDIALITIHPAAILRETTPLSLCIEDLKKARDFTKQGYKVIVLLGGKSVKQFLKYGSNVTKWRGHYAWLKKEKMEDIRREREEKKR